MHLSSNLAHWVCLVAGLYLVLTGFLLRDIAEERPPRIVHPAGAAAAAARHRAAGYGRRVVMVAVGLLAAMYGIARLLE